MRAGFKFTNNIDKTYDKIFKIIDSNSTFFRANTEKEFKVEDGYVIIIDDIGNESVEKILELKGVVEYTEE